MNADAAGFAMQSTVVEAAEAARRDGRALVIGDVSPPRGAAIDAIAEIGRIPTDFYCVAYAPGRAVRLDSLAMAVLLRAATGRGTVFNLATRDMNALALESHLLGAQALGQPNVVVIRGDDLTERDRALVKPVHNTTPTGLLHAIADMNEGRDFRGSPLRAPTRLCPGAAFDLSRGDESEAALTGRKLRAGARFLLAQAIYDPADAQRFLGTYRRVNGEDLTVPVFWGFPVLAPGSITFGEPPARWREQMEAGRDGADLAAEQLRRFTEAGLNTFYLMPPILRGGARDYAAAADALIRGLGRSP